MPRRRPAWHLVALFVAGFTLTLALRWPQPGFSETTGETRTPRVPGAPMAPRTAVPETPSPARAPAPSPAGFEPAPLAAAPTEDVDARLRADPRMELAALVVDYDADTRAEALSLRAAFDTEEQ